MYELVMVKNKSDGLHNKGCYHKGQYNVMFLYIKGLTSKNKKRMTTSVSLCEGPIFYFYIFTFMYYARVNIISSHFNLNYSLVGKHHVVGNDPGTDIQLNIGNHELLLLTLSLR